MPHALSRLPSGRSLALSAAALALVAAAAPAVAETAFDMRGAAELAGVRAFDRPAARGDRHGLYVGYALTGEVEHTTDSGLTFGFVGTLGSGDYERSLTRPGDNADITLNEAYFQFVSAWGQVRLGDEDGAAKRAVDLLPLIGGGQMDGLWSGLSGAKAPVDHLGRDSDDATKLLYETPRVLGLRLGVSYAPERQSVFENIARRSPVPAEKDFWEFGLNYRGDADAWSYELAAGYGFADAGAARLAQTETLKLAGLVGYGGFSVGAVWFLDEVGRRPGGASDQQGLTLMGSYENGPYGIALWAQDLDVDTVSERRSYGLGLSWRFAGETTLGLDLVRFDDDPTGPAPERTGSLAQLAVAVRF